MCEEEPTAVTESSSKNTIYQFEKAIKEKNALGRSKVVHETEKDNLRDNKDLFESE